MRIDPSSTFLVPFSFVVFPTSSLTITYVERQGALIMSLVLFRMTMQPPANNG